MHRTGRYRGLIWFGAMMTALGVGLFALLAPDTPRVQSVLFQIIAGACMDSLLQAPIIAIQAAVSQADIAAATSTFGSLRKVATSVSLVVGAVVFQNGMEDRLVSMVDVGISQEVIAALSNVMMTYSTSDPMQREAVEAAFAWSLRNMWIMFGGIAGLGTIASVFVAQQHLKIEHVETKTGIESKQKQGSGKRVYCTE